MGEGFLGLPGQAPVVRRWRLPLAGWPPALAGLRLAHLTDFHADRRRWPVLEARLRRVEPVLRAWRPHLILLTGDFVAEEGSAVDLLAPFLEGWARRAPLGAWAVLGNHDYWDDPERVARGLRAAGVRLLRNEGVRLPFREGSLELWGVEDRWIGAARPQVWDGTPPPPAEGGARARDRDPPSAAPLGGVGRILLSHTPDLAEDLPAGTAHLILSGHTHGGHWVLPGVGPLWIPSFRGWKYLEGAVATPAGLVYVSRGIGGRPALRIGCPPEAALLELVPRL